MLYLRMYFVLTSAADYDKHPNGRKAALSNELALGYRSIVAGMKKVSV